MSDSLLEKSLDDIIGETKKPFKRGGKQHAPKRQGSKFGSRINKPSRPHPVNIRRSGPIPPSARLPRDIVNIARGRPVLRVKNIHPDLNGEDLSKLFGSISPVDFVKFDNKDDTMAYVCFHSDNQRSNGESVAKFDGKKAMGNRLVVEVATSLADRIQVQSIHRDQQRNPKHDPRKSQKPKPKHAKKPKPEKKSLDMLDEELNAYMNQSGNDTGDQADQPQQNEPQADQQVEQQPGGQGQTEQENDDMNLD